MAGEFQSNSYTGLIDALKEAESVRAPNPSVSRISTFLTPRWEKIAIFLLLQLDTRVLQAILDNTLPSRALTDLRPVVRTVQSTTALTTAQGDPVIYINWLADKDGHGLSIGEYTEFLDALEVAARIKADRVAPSRQPGNLTIRSGVRDVYASTGATDTLVQQSDVSKLRNAALSFLNQNRNVVLPRATSQSVTEIMMRAEVGWAVDFTRRAGDHSSLTVYSPLLFRVANCLLQYLFPNRDFQMHQFAVLTVTDPNEAAIGESILSHLAAAYVGYGGFNLTQAGVHTSSAWAAGNRSSINWRLVTDQAVTNGAFLEFPANATALRLHLEARQKANGDALQWHRSHAAFLQQSQESTRALNALEDIDRDLRAMIFDLEQKVEELKRLRTRAEETSKRIKRGIGAVRSLLSGLAAMGGDVPDTNDGGNPAT